MNKYYLIHDEILKVSKKLLNKTGYDDNEILNKYVLNKVKNSDDFIRYDKILNEYIEENKNDKDVINYIKLNKERLLINNYIEEKKELCKEKMEKEMEERKERNERLEKEEYDQNQRKMKIYDKEVCRFTNKHIELKEIPYICMICDFKRDSSHKSPLERQLVIKEHFDLKFHKYNVDSNLTINIKKSIEDKFIDIIFTFNIYEACAFYQDIYFKKLFANTILNNQKKDKNYKYTILMINARNNINNIFAEKIIVNDILDDLEYYKDNNLIKFLRKNNPEDDELYNYENEVIQEFRKNNQYCREIEYRRLFKMVWNKRF